MDYKEKYKKALERARKIHNETKFDYEKGMMEEIFPELKESEDERIRKDIKQHFLYLDDSFPDKAKWLAWLEKQGQVKESSISQHEIETCKENNDSLTSEGEKMRKAIYIYLDWLDGRKDYAPRGEYTIRDMLDWLEKQGEQKKFANKEFTFKAIPRLLEMIQPNDRAKSYCQKLIDSLEQECYSTDAEIVRVCLKEMNGEKVAMATMDEQKYADKVKPKFHEGEWVVWQDKCYKVNYNGCGYELVDQNGLSTSLEYGTIDENAHLWTIQDAKDGDVLADVHGNIGIIQMYGDFDWRSYCSLGCNGGFQGFIVEHEIEGTYPATKEQRDLLFQRLKEAGYEWSDKDRKLIKIAQ